MLSLINIFWEFAVDISENIILLYLLQHKLSRRNSTTSAKYSILFVLFLSGCTYLLNLLNAPKQISVSCLLIIGVVLARKLFTNSLLLLLFWNITYSILTIIADILCLALPSIFLHIPISELLLGGAFRYPGTVLYILLFTLPVIIICYFPNNDLFLDWTEKIGFALLSTAYILIGEYILATAIQLQSKNHPHMANRLFIFCLIYLMTYAIVFWYIHRLGISRQENVLLLSQQKTYELEKNNLQHWEKTITQLRYIKHDLNKNLSIIQGLAKSKKYDDLQHYIDAYLNSFNEAQIYLNTGNSAVDCVISTYLGKAHTLGINFNYIIHLPDQLNLDHVLLCSLLGNLCENALTACESLKDDLEQPSIEMTIKPYQESLIISTSNPFDGNYRFKNGHYLTTKADSDSHGLGLNRIQDIVNIYGGMLQINTSDNIFQVTIILPLMYQSNDKES